MREHALRDGPAPASEAPPDQVEARRMMVENQIRTFDVTDRAVLAAFERVPREIFVEPADRPLAYSDARLVVRGLEESRALLVPLVLARLVQALAPEPDEHALDLCGGLGYSAAILAMLGLDVHVAERDPGLASRAAQALASLPGRLRLLPSAPYAADFAAMDSASYDLILLNGAVEREPTAFFALLRNGGRLGLIRRGGHAAQARIYLRTGETVSCRTVFDAQAPVLPGFAAQPGFVF